MTIYLKAGLLEGPEIVNDKMVSIIFYELPYTKNYFLLNLVPYHNDFWNQNAKHRRFMGKYQKNINELVLPVLRNPAEIEKHHLDPLRLLYVLARSSLSDSQ